MDRVAASFVRSLLRRKPPPAWRPVLTGVATGIGVGAALASLSWPDGKDPGDHPVAAYGLPEGGGGDVLAREGYVTCYDRRTRTPRWVAERLTPGGLSGSAKRRGVRFVEDEDVPPEFRAQLTHFRGSGYDRGHMAPAGNHKQSMLAMRDTFKLTNVAPQVGKGMNRDMWARFEQFCREVVVATQQDVYVVTGPLFLPQEDGSGRWVVQYPTLGAPPDLVHVPTHFFKVILVGGVHYAAFVMPNEVIDDATKLEAFEVPIDGLERAAGLAFFPVVRNRLKAAAPAAPAAPPSTAPPSTPLVVAKSGPEAPRVQGPWGRSTLCGEVVRCELPGPSWWEKKKQKALPAPK